ncbi:MAG: hypothetical protein DHS20C15_32900 [Planctomycetota bacterium]|nr:MAG: hypothetical protein DHS20C15_32900 [Planctomycetota bacterium]
MRSLALGLGLLATLSMSAVAQQAPSAVSHEALLGAALTPALGSAVSWTIDETTTGGDVNWVSPTSVDPNAFAYESVVTIEMVEVTATVIIPITVDVTDEIPPEQLVVAANFAGPAPLALLDFDVIVPEPPEPTAVAGTFSFGLDASGKGYFNLVDVTLGSTVVDTPFGTVTAPITALRIVASVTLQPVSWLDLGLGLAGSAELPPVLDGFGELAAGAPVGLTLSNALPGAQSFVVFGTSNLSLAFKQGTLVPSPDFISNAPPVNAGGGWTLPATWPAGVPAGFEIFFQTWIADPAAPAGFSASNGLVGEAS